MPETWTIGRLLTWTTDFLKQHGVESPRLDAEVLLAFARKCERIDLYAAFNEPADENTRQTYRELVRRRAEGTPVAYLVGFREFYSMNFRVTPDVLIPRPETEFLVVALLDKIRERGAGHNRDGYATEKGHNRDGYDTVRVADVGTGSGIIAVAAARHAPHCRVTAVDLQPAALEVARGNAAEMGVADRIDFIQSDLLEQVPPGERFDCIASNPPYVSSAEMHELAREVRQHEPRTALHAGERGTEVIERLLVQAADRLEPQGWLLVEISPMLHQAVEQLVAASGAFELGPTVKDLASLPRVVQAQKRNGG